MKNLQKNAHGSVRAYTRHGVDCPHASDPEYNTCSCPKWLYLWKRETGRQSRKSLNTPSWAEAQRIASDILRGLDPEIKAARAITDKHDKDRMTVADACALWIDRSKALGVKSGTTDQYLTLNAKLIEWAEGHGVAYIQDITPLHLQRWYSSSAWSHYAPSTKAQRWGCIRSMFEFFALREVTSKSAATGIQRSKVEVTQVQGPYTDEQVEKILAHIAPSMAFNLPMHLRETRTPRLRAFINLLLHTGCDVSDAVLHEPSRIETCKVGKKTVHIYRYRRLKTRRKVKAPAVIPISAELAAELQSVPLEPSTTKEMPFRHENLTLRSDQRKWSDRVMVVMDAAGIDQVELPPDEQGRPQSKDANVKMLRHTFAVRMLIAGQRPEEVAKMLGHVDTKMVLRVYAPWVKELDDAHIRRVTAIGSW
jgi:site-specific recombinase XerD